MWDPVRETHGPHRKPPVETFATESKRVKATGHAKRVKAPLKLPAMHGIKTSQTRLPELAAAGHLTSPPAASETHTLQIPRPSAIQNASVLRPGVRFWNLPLIGR